MAIVVAVVATVLVVFVVVAVVNKLRASLPAVFAVNSVLQNSSSHTPNTIKLMKSQRTQWQLAKGARRGTDRQWVCCVWRQEVLKYFIAI